MQSIEEILDEFDGKVTRLHEQNSIALVHKGPVASDFGTWYRADRGELHAVANWDSVRLFLQKKLAREHKEINGEWRVRLLEDIKTLRKEKVIPMKHIKYVMNSVETIYRDMMEEKQPNRIVDDAMPIHRGS